MHKIMFVLLLALVVAGCGGGALQRIHQANEAAHGLSSTALPAFDLQCQTEAGACNLRALQMRDDCEAAGGPTCAETAKAAALACVEAGACTKGRRGFVAAIKTVHAGAATAATLSTLGEEDDIQAIAVRVVSALATAYQLVREAGILEQFGLKES